MKLLILSFVFLFSCSTAPTTVDAPSTDEAKSIATDTKPNFSIAKDGVTGIEVKDGEVFVSGKMIGKMFGPTMLAADGSVSAVIENNRILNSNGKTLVLLDEAGNLDNGSGILLSWSPDGHFMQGAEDLGFVLEPNDAKLYHSASYVLFLFLYVQSVASTAVKSDDAREAFIKAEDERLERLYSEPANAKCKTSIPWSIDWKSFEGESDRRLSEEATSSVYAACGIPLDRLGDVCGDDRTNKIKQMVSSFRCVLGTNKLRVALDKGKLQYFVDFEANDAYGAFDTFLVKKRLVESKPKPKELSAEELEKIRQILGGGRKIQQCYKACEETRKTAGAQQECRSLCQ